MRRVVGIWIFTRTPLQLGMMLLLAAVLTQKRISPAVAAPRDELIAARQDFRSGNFSQALPKLNYLLYPTPRLANPDDLVEAHTLLGACSVEVGDRVTAIREFEQALYMAQDTSLDVLLFSAEAIKQFEQTKSTVTARTLRDAEARALATERDRLKQYRDSLIVYEVRPFYVNFIPFGIGQFQNRQVGKGLLFASSQLVTGGASMGIWIYLVRKYGYGGSVPAVDAGFARRLQQIEIGTGAACLGLMAWGIVDSVIHYQPRTQVSSDDSLLPPAANPPRTSLRIAPALIERAGGLMIWGEF
jgi:tetratricopeptide (TPR) repeat protein